MAVTCSDVWNLAKILEDLAKNPHIAPDIKEPLERAAVGKAYYAIYHRGLLYAAARGFDSKAVGGSVHAALWKWFKDKGDDEHELISRIGKAMHKRRTAADYKLGKACPSIDDQIADANLIVETLIPLEAVRPSP